LEIASGSYLAIERMIADCEADIGFARLTLEKPGLRHERFSRRRPGCRSFFGQA
jgi:hypothetical protein